MVYLVLVMYLSSLSLVEATDTEMAVSSIIASSDDQSNSPGSEILPSVLQIPRA